MTYEEFYDLLLQDRQPHSEFILDCEDVDGNTTYLRFRVENFFGVIILYTCIAMEGADIIQNDAMGWDANIRRAWEYITESLELKPFFAVDVSGKNLFE